MRFALALFLLAGCASPDVPNRPKHAYHLAKDHTLEFSFTPAADRAVVVVAEGRLDVIFRGPKLHVRARVEAGGRRGTIEPDAVATIVVTALEASVFTVQTD